MQEALDSNPSTREVRAGGSTVQGYPLLSTLPGKPELLLFVLFAFDLNIANSIYLTENGRVPFFCVHIISFPPCLCVPLYVPLDINMFMLDSNVFM